MTLGLGALTLRTYEGDDGRPAYQAPEINVNIGGLEDFSQLLRAEIDAGFKPGKERVASEHVRGVGFGERNPSMEMRAAREKYRECLNRAVENLTAYVYFSEILITAVDKIAAEYRDSDAFAAASQQKVELALATALFDAKRAQDEEADRQLQREIARLRIGGTS